MSDSDDFWDDQPKGQNDDEDSAPDDWDVDSDEEREKKVAKEKEEAERKLKQKNMKQKIKEKEERERKEKEERIAELNRVKSEAEKQEEQESAAMKIVDAQLGDFALDDDDTALRREVAEAASSNKKLKASLNDSAHPLLTSSIKTKADADKYSDLICDKLYEYRDSSQFNYLLEQVSRKMGERQDFKNHESVKLMGKNLQQIGNKKYTDWKDSKNPKKKKKGASNAPSLAKRADTAMVGLDLDEEFDVDEDDFM